MIYRWLLALALALGVLAIVFKRRPVVGDTRDALVTHPVHLIAKRALGDGWHAFLLRVDGGPWAGWYAVRGLGFASELVVGGGGMDTEEEARAAFAELQQP